MRLAERWSLPASILLDKLKIDDPVGAWPVHGLCGIWGGLATGIFGDLPDGISSVGAFITVQAIGTVVIVAWAFITMLGVFLALKAVGMLRVSAGRRASRFGYLRAWHACLPVGRGCRRSHRLELTDYPPQLRRRDALSGGGAPGGRGSNQRLELLGSCLGQKMPFGLGGRPPRSPGSGFSALSGRSETVPIEPASYGVGSFRFARIRYRRTPQSRVFIVSHSQTHRTVKLIIAIIQPGKLEAVKEALTQVEVFRLTVMDCQGFGRQKGQTGVYRGHEFSVNLLRKVQLQIAVNEEFVQPTIDAILKGGRSGREWRDR